MADTLDQIKQQIARFKKEKPYYRESLDLYALILEEQARIRPQLKIAVPQVNEKLVRSRRPAPEAPGRRPRRRPLPAPEAPASAARLRPAPDGAAIP